MKRWNTEDLDDMSSGRDFLKSGFKVQGGFKESPRTFMNDFRTVCIKYTNGKVIEKTHITEHWKYIAKLKKAVDVEDAWIKDE